MTQRTLAFALSVATLLAAPNALAQKDGQALALFNGGAAMYENAHYVEAIQAFEAAYRLAPRPGIQFSMAQAHKKQFLLSKSPENLREAMRNYREYVAKTPSGGRRTEAVQSITELEPFASRVDMSAPAPSSKTTATRVMVSSQTKGAVLALDGQSAPETPYAWEVKPGKHHVSVTAPGFFPEEVDIVALEGGIVPLNIDLREMPAHVAIATDSGAQVSLDGRLIGTTPLPKALDAEPGVHLISVTKNGFKPWSDEVELKHGETRTLDVKLPRTGQRVASYLLLGAGAASFVVGGLFIGLAYREQTDAQAILDRRKTANIGPADLDRYNAARDARETDKRIAGVAFGVGGTAAVTGLLLYAFDQPTPGATLPRRDEKSKPAPKEKKTKDLEVAFVPAAGAELLGGVVLGRF